MNTETHQADSDGHNFPCMGQETKHLDIAPAIHYIGVQIHRFMLDVQGSNSFYFLALSISKVTSTRLGDGCSMPGRQ